MKQGGAIKMTELSPARLQAHLNLASNLVGDGGAAELAAALGNPACGLAELCLNNNAIGDAGAAALARAVGGRTCGRLRYLSVGGNRRIGLAARQSLAVALRSAGVGSDLLPSAVDSAAFRDVHAHRPAGWYMEAVSKARAAVGEASAILLHPPPPFSRRFNMDGRGDRTDSLADGAGPGGPRWAANPAARDVSSAAGGLGEGVPAAPVRGRGEYGGRA